jgi:hypothetical protein
LGEELQNPVLSSHVPAQTAAAEESSHSLDLSMEEEPESNREPEPDARTSQRKHDEGFVTEQSTYCNPDKNKDASSLPGMQSPASRPASEGTVFCTPAGAHETLLTVTSFGTPGCSTPGLTAFETPLGASPVSKSASEKPSEVPVNVGELHVGARVEAMGLVSASYLNGKHGTVVTANKPGDDRWGVRFDCKTYGDDESTGVRVANLRLVEDEHNAHPHSENWGVLGRVMNGVASVLEKEEELVEGDMDKKRASESVSSSSDSYSSNVESNSEFSIHQAERTPARGIDDVRYSLPPHDSADHRPPPSDTDASYSEDEAHIPSWCQSWKAVEKTLAEQVKWGPGGSHDLLLKNKQPPLRIEEVFSNDAASSSKMNARR